MNERECNDLKVTMQEYQKEIDEHKITDEKNIRSNKAIVDAFGQLCTSKEKVSCDDLKHAAENWREEIDKFTTKIPIIPLLGWVQGKGTGYYKKVQDGVDAAVKELCR